MEEERKSLREEIKDNLFNQNRNITISFPPETYLEFKKYAKDNSGDCYWLAIKDLLNQSKYSKFLSETVQVLIQNNNLLLNKIMELDNRVLVLEQEKVLVTEPVIEEKKVRKHFGEME